MIMVSKLLQTHRASIDTAPRAFGVECVRVHEGLHGGACNADLGPNLVLQQQAKMCSWFLPLPWVGGHYRATRGEKVQGDLGPAWGQAGQDEKATSAK